MTQSLIFEVEELKGHLQNLERQLLLAAIELARKIYKSLLEKIDKLIQQHRPGEFSVAHKRSVWIKSWLGPVQVTRRQYRDREGKYRYFLDELMGMKKYRHTTAAVQEIALELAGNMSFRRSAEMLRKTTAVDLSAQTIQRLLGRIADNRIENDDRNREYFQQTGEIPVAEGRSIERLLIEADGVMLSLQRETASKAEAKLGIVYEGWRKVGKDRYRTLNKTIYADVASPESFWDGITLNLHRKYDLSGVEQTIVAGDGAEWIKEGAEYFGGQYQLCRYHLNRELGYALGHDRQKLKSIKRLCNSGKINEALDLLKEASCGVNEAKLQNIIKAARYLESNAVGLIDYRKGIPEQIGLRRTGAIEGNIDKVIVRRMKNQGMSWTYQGIRRMLWLRTRLYEGTLRDSLRHCNKSHQICPIPVKRVNNLICRRLKDNYASYFTAMLPALSGPHSSRPWVKVLKSLAGLGL